MAYTYEDWIKRVKNRTDLSGYLFHMTKPAFKGKDERVMSALDRLLKIISERKLIGSSSNNGFINGNKKAICFQDTPIHSLVENVQYEFENREQLGGKIRYLGYGLAFPKPYIYNAGGRPVFYEKKEVAKSILAKEEWWRIVDYNLSNKNNLIDWTHEREWRLQQSEFIFDISKVIIILPNKEEYKQFVSRVSENDIKSFNGIVQTSVLVL